MANILPWEQINKNILNVANTLESFLDTANPADVTWFAVNDDGTTTEVKLPNLAKLLQQQKTELEASFVKKQSDTDIEFTSNALGVVLADRADGKKYRVYVENGTLKTEAI
jgi:hypothetical protein